MLKFLNSDVEQGFAVEILRLVLAFGLTLLLLLILVLP